MNSGKDFGFILNSSSAGFIHYDFWFIMISGAEFGFIMISGSA